MNVHDKVFKLNDKVLCEVGAADLWNAYLRARRIRIHAQIEHVESAKRYEEALLDELQRRTNKERHTL
jgi:hypothetical protein